MSKLGEYITERRNAKGWSKRELAMKSDVSHAEVHRIENGERQNPSPILLNKIAATLGVPQEEIMRIAGYAAGVEDVPMIAKVFPDLKTEKQQQTVQKIVDGIARNTDLDESIYDDLVRQMEMVLDYAEKKRNNS